jgi:hypothetical protein
MQAGTHVSRVWDIRASRKQIHILVLWDGDAEPLAYRHDDVVNRVEDMTDMLDGRGVRVGMRVERLPERRLRLTGEAFGAEPDPDPAAPDKGKDTPEKFMAHMKGLDARWTRGSRPTTSLSTATKWRGSSNIPLKQRVLRCHPRHYSRAYGTPLST